MSPTLKSTGHFGSKFPVAPFGVDPFGSAESERPTLTNRGIIFEEFQPVITIHQRHKQAVRHTDGQPNDMRYQDRALH